MKTGRRAFSRGEFLKAALISPMTATFPHVLRSQGGRSPGDKLNIAVVGVGGRGKAAVDALKTENLVAFCDVDEERAAETFAQHPQVPRFQDFRRMFDQLADEIDGVAISTPDHMHYPIAVAALRRGKHVFVEKPLAHTVWEARQRAQLAAEKKVATQMGNQGRAKEGPRLLKEWIQAGVLGEVRELHSWTNRPVWPQGVGAPDHSRLVPVPPAGLDWDLWLGVGLARPYDSAYLPFKWRGYWDFGTGALGDMGCHLLDGAYWALDLDAPVRVEAISARQTVETGPVASMIVYDFPARRGMPPVRGTHRL
jgi:predicted dehydrogenase